MNLILATNKFHKSLAGILAMLATVVVLGAPLTLAEYYAQTGGSADHVAASAMADEVALTLPRNS